MKFATVFALMSLATAVTAKHYCFGGCVKCYCGDIHCNHNAYKSTDPNNKQGNCDQPGGFHLGCGYSTGGKCF
ncbi:hypothetical protein CGLO_07291 [Colletotrichum gloeosporioides Cg-14]|uniref:Uncharacterized protein n=1 Tax=Colletotrichum gloeosporioides (strain Cg-14) TaxID=1237896 RepID=T0LXC2_COLGC|nr:hypothetical protein CGLO_07291 [Colletotrichum gloeosporioides Cg-14]